MRAVDALLPQLPMRSLDDDKFSDREISNFFPLSMIERGRNIPPEFRDLSQISVKTVDEAIGWLRTCAFLPLEFLPNAAGHPDRREGQMAFSKLCARTALTLASNTTTDSPRILTIASQPLLLAQQSAAKVAFAHRVKKAGGI